MLCALNRHPHSPSTDNVVQNVQADQDNEDVERNANQHNDNNVRGKGRKSKKRRIIRSKNKLTEKSYQVNN